MQLSIFKLVDIIFINISQDQKNEFKKQLGYFLTNENKSFESETRLIIRGFEKIEVNNNHLAFGSFLAFDEFLYIKQSNGSLLGFSFNDLHKITIHCETNVPGEIVFYLADILIRNLVISTNHAFIHASAFEINKKAYVFPAWGGTGKTNLLLNYLNRGAKYLSDDILLVSNQGCVYPYPRPLNLLYYNFISQRNILSNVLSLQMKIILFFHPLISKMVIGSKHFKLLHFILKELLLRFEFRLNMHIDANDLFSKNIISTDKLSNCRIFYLYSVLFGNPKIETINPIEISDRMKACHRWERNYFTDVFLAYTYAYPEKEKLTQDILDKEAKIIYDFINSSEVTKKIQLPKNGKVEDIIKFIDESL